MKEIVLGCKELVLGCDVCVVLDADGGGLIWRHACPRSRAWNWLRFRPDPRSTGHELVHLQPLTIRGSLICPQGCGKHGEIRGGVWVPC